jgi:hypothetical protein
VPAARVSVEDAHLIEWTDTVAMIADFHERPLRFGGYRNLECVLVATVLGGIAEQVDDNAPQKMFVTPDHNRSLGHSHIDSLIAEVQQWLDNWYRAFQTAAQIERLAAKLVTR